jgi:hypothetical protein
MSNPISQVSSGPASVRGETGLPTPPVLLEKDRQSKPRISPTSGAIRAAVIGRCSGP